MCSFPYLFRIVRIVCAWPTPWHTLLAALHAVRILHVAARDNIGCTCNLYLVIPVKLLELADAFHKKPKPAQAQTTVGGPIANKLQQLITI